ncbi:alpha/beta hydrolase [Luteimonas pelagia]
MRARRKQGLPVLAVLSLALAGCGAGATPEAAPDVERINGALRYGGVGFESCALSVPLGDAVEAQCATVPVPEDHDAPGGRKIDLAVAWIPASGEAEADPVVFIAGGPGQSALESYPLVHAAFKDVRRSRHVLLVDARGTGGSHPLACTDERGENAFTDPDQQTAEAARAFAVRCRDQLSATADLRFYGTADHVRDLDHVRALVGAPRINLVGVSYGTRVAQQYAAHHPDHVRTVVLDSVVPNTLVLGAAHARNLQDALDRLFERCRDASACVGQLGDPSAHLAALTTRLKAGNLVPVGYRDPLTGEWREEAPQYGHLVGLLRMYAYQPAAMATLPLLLHEAAEGRYQAMLAQSRMLTADIGDMIMHGMQLSVMCTEDFPELEARPEDAETVLGNELVDYTRAQCEVWPAGQRGDDFREPLSTDVPLLAISGQFDPVTPPRYGDEVVETLPNGRHLVLPGQGHSVLGAGCMPTLFAQFVESADAASLDAGCLSRLQPTPPFAGTYGWEP